MIEGPGLQHRIMRNYKAAGKGIDTKAIIKNLLKLVKESDYTGKKVKTVSPGITLDLRGLKKKSPSEKIASALKKVTGA